MRSTLLVALVTLFVVLAAPRRARANMAQPSAEGELTGVLEPEASASIRIEAETLTFDVAEGLAEAAVTAVYRMTNGGATASDRDIAFVYVAGEREGGPKATVEVDGQAVPFAPIAELGSASPGWGKPSASRKRAFLRFRLPLAPGQTRTVKVAYRQEASWDTHAGIHTSYAYDYLLSPAKSWASFGPLDIAIRLPANTRFSSSLSALKREGDRVSAKLPVLPEGELRFEIASTRGLWFGMTGTGGYWTIYLVVLAAAVLGIGIATGKLWRARPPWQQALARLLVSGLLGSLGAGLVMMALFGAMPGNGLGYSGGIMGVLMTMAAWPVTAVTSFVSARMRRVAVDPA